MDFLAQAKALEAELRDIRETLHRHPEIGNSESFTSSFLEKKLKGLGLEVTRPFGTALVAVLHGAKKGSRVALRADIDALPITEQTGCPFSSENHGMMHACGHDIHMTAALGTAMLLSKVRDELCGDVVFLFEPDEEGSGGARKLIDSGALEGVSSVFGGHVVPDLPLGTVGFKYGKFYAASLVFKVLFKGTSCHGATPEKGNDALLAASETVLNLKTIKPSSGDKAVISTGILKAGTACNIIAGEAEIEGVMRTLGKDDLQEMEKKFRQVVGDACSRYGCSAEINLRGTHMGVVNSDEQTAFMEKSARQVLGDDKVRVLDEPTMVTEDFGYYVDACGGCFCHIGAGSTQPLHSPVFLPDIKAAITASAVYAQTIDNCLRA